jgi:glycosyltransferase involved in cell wall biosynthesis
VNQPEKNPDDRVVISVVLPVLNEAKDIGRLLAELMSQESPDGGFEIIVADGGSTDGTRRIVEEVSSRNPQVRLVENPGVRSSAGRNAGAREARGTYVLFLDGHCRIPTHRYLIRVQEIFQETGAACLCRPQPLRELAHGTWSNAIAAARHSWLGHNPGSDIYGDQARFTDPRSAGAAYHREVLLDLGGYDERFDACEDVEFNHRIATAGLPAYVHPDLRVDYRPRNSLRAFFRQMHRYGRGRAHLMARHGVVPLPLVAVTLGLWLIPLIGLRWSWTVAAVVLGSGVFLWLLAVAAESLRLGGFSARSGRVALVFSTLYAGLFIGFWKGGLEMFRYRSPGQGVLSRPDRRTQEERVSRL